MQHVMIDGFRGFRSRFDQLQLIQEILEEVPCQLGLQPTMPAFLLPYYNGVVPEDCGVSAFVFLAGGHFTLHTFSFREVYFADMATAAFYDHRRLQSLLEAVLPCEMTTVSRVTRAPGALRDVESDAANDFGPHLLLDLDDYQGPRTLDDLFDLFDRLPAAIGMTPIMRPYVVRNATADGPVTSAMTMIAESHISLHVFEATRRAYFDLFSCRFFDRAPVVARIRAELGGGPMREALVTRGSKYRLLRTEREVELSRSKRWLHALKDDARPE